jgi:hypothetical protein
MVSTEVICCFTMVLLHSGQWIVFFSNSETGMVREKGLLHFSQMNSYTGIRNLLSSLWGYQMLKYRVKIGLCPSVVIHSGESQSNFLMLKIGCPHIFTIHAVAAFSSEGSEVASVTVVIQLPQIAPSCFNGTLPFHHRWYAGPAESKIDRG